MGGKRGGDQRGTPLKGTSTHTHPCTETGMGRGKKEKKSPYIIKAVKAFSRWGSDLLLPGNRSGLSIIIVIWVIDF